jgi:hypothetical protein
VGSIDVGVLSSLNWKSYPGNARKLGLTLRLSMFASGQSRHFDRRQITSGLTDKPLSRGRKSAV